MKRKSKFILRILASTVSVVLLASAFPFPSSELTTADAAQTTTISNPIIWADVPDEDIIRVGDTYYMVSTTMYFSPGAPIMKSKDLVSWKICNYVYDTYADGDKQTLKNGENDYSHGQWAASLRYHDGNFYVFFGSYGTGKSYIYKTSDIENGTWTRSEINGMYHDASMLFDDDGRNYLVYGAGGTAKIKEFNSDMTGFKKDGVEQTLFSTGLDNLAGEGWHIQKINGYYYIFVIAWPSNSKRIELCYRSKELLGTYEGKTILNSGLGTYGSGVAQGGIVDTPDGKWYGLLFQDHGSVGRIPVLVPVTWENNWPMMGVNGEAPLTLEIDRDYAGTQLAKDDDFTYSSNKLALEWQWNHNPDNTAWSVTERPGYLRLKNNTLATNLLDAKNTLTQRAEGPSCSSVIKLDTSGMKAGDYAGLSAFQFKYGNVGVYVSDDGTKKIYMANNGGYSDSATVGDSYNNIIEQTNLSGNEIYLKVDFLFNTVDSTGNSSYNIDKANFYYSYDGADWKKIGEELSMVYSLTLFAGYRSGIYSYATKTTGGYADIDSFDYERADWNAPTVIKPNEYGWYFADGFEGDIGSWQARGSASIQTSGRTAYVGSEALLIQNRTAAWNGAYKTLNPRVFLPGNAYSFSVNVTYFDGAATDKFYLKLQYIDANGDTQYDTIAEGTGIKGEWIQLANTNYQIPAGASNMQLYVETANTTNDFYIDEAIGAVGGIGILGAGVSKDIILGDLNSDNVINAIDLCLAKHGVSYGFDSKRYEVAADVDQSGTVDVTDLKLIRDFLFAKITEFPIAEKQDKPIKSIVSMKEYTARVSANILETEPAEEREEKSGVTYGTVQKVSYYSTTCKRTRCFNILLPANYSESKQYPVLYAMHGYWQAEDTLIDETDKSMRLRQIIGNAIASGEAKDMIVVFPYIYASETQDSCSGMNEENNTAYDNFINELTNDLMPYIESHYSVKTGKDNTAIMGFSMGGRESLYISMKRPDLFGYVGAVCPAPGVSPGLIAKSDFQYTDESPYLLLLTAGSNDTVVYSTPSGYHDILNNNGVPHIWHYVKDGYHGGNCIRAHMYNFVRAVFKATD